LQGLILVFAAANVAGDISLIEYFLRRFLDPRIRY
jgi:hypothetical protein